MKAIKIISLAIASLFFSELLSQNAGTNNKLHTLIASLQKDPDLQNATWGISVLNIRKDSVIAEYNSFVSLIPASTNKIITTTTALALLGAEFQYETKLEYSGTFDSTSGILNGNIYINGSGDPTLSSEVYKTKNDTLTLTDQWARIISSFGIKKINGAIIGDARNFEDERVPNTWIWGDMGNYYGAGACGLNYLDNKYGLHFNSGTKVGDGTVINKIIPPIPGLEFINQTFTKGNSDNAYIFGAPYTLSRYVKGTIPANKKNYKVEGSQPDPPLLCAQHLDSSLRKIGVPISKKSNTLRNFLPSADEFIGTEEDSLVEKAEYIALPQEKNETRKLIYSHFSPTLDKIVYETNIHSNNLYAEALLKTIAWKKNKIGNDQAGIGIVLNYWKSKKLNINGFNMADGCGLSRFNSTTTKTLSSLLALASKDSVLYKNLSNSMPLSGKTGSLAGMCKGTCAENNLRAKSGYMTRVRSYAGYVTNKSGDLLSFAIIANNYTCSPAEMKKKIERLLIAIAETK